MRTDTSTTTLNEKVFLETAEQAARLAGEELRRRWRQGHQVRSKGLRDIVTEADMAAEEAVLSHIRRHFPHHAILAEETSPTDNATDAEFQWIIDPLDGTTNYAHGLPIFSVSIALFHQGAPLLGVVYDPLREALYRAWRGGGAYLNDAPLHVSGRTTALELIIACDFPRAQEPRRRMTRFLAQMSTAVGEWRVIGSAALGLCLVADGSADLYMHLTLQPWDLAAAGLIIEEAGGRVTSIEGRPEWWKDGAVMASNGMVHDEMLALFHTIDQGT